MGSRLPGEVVWGHIGVGTTKGMCDREEMTSGVFTVLAGSLPHTEWFRERDPEGMSRAGKGTLDVGNPG